ncbi:hypothetical protein SAMN05428950_101554 [Sphingomonas sp. OV641]|uniref:hypothetical protein n=1 Tax=Sphingomonas sp. OV641 TaxID=1881068 RepID=UPI0008D1EA43|nr:hypothetical protein [Sphingomonas sp. OV641]SEI91341.1 hypothetical protein SAMN05428950_101554 [Sphingomonas sp. OV641]
MKRAVSAGLIGVALAAAAVSAQEVGSDPEPTPVECHHTIMARAVPISGGPYRLANVYCPPRLNSSTSMSAPALSPDGRHYLVSGYKRLWIGSIGSSTLPRMIETREGIASLGYSNVPPFAWAQDSKTVLGVRRDTVEPSGFARGPLSPIAIPIEGEPYSLRPMTYPAGGLDGVFWVGNSGLAVAEFGTKGGYYRPEHDDPTPTLGIINARRGKVLQAVPLPLALGTKPRTLVGLIDARLDRRGKVHAVFKVSDDRWFEWRQGMPLREMRLEIGPRGSAKFALSPDLKRILIMAGLSAKGWICEHYNPPPRRPECEKRTPQSGTVAALWDIETGRKLWSIDGTAYGFSSSWKPAISPDGRLALVSMPPDKTSREDTIALISMSDGREIQRFNKPESFDFDLRFGRDSRSFSIVGNLAIIDYKLSE